MWSCSRTSAVASEVLSLLFGVAPSSHWNNASTRARLLDVCSLAVSHENDHFRRSAQQCLSVAAPKLSADARKSVGEWARQQMVQQHAKRDEQHDDVAVKTAHLLAGSLSPCLNSALVDFVMKQAAARARPQFVAAAFRCCGAAVASGAINGVALLKKLSQLAPPLESSEARTAWTGAVGAAASVVKGACEGGPEEELVLEALETLCNQLGQGDKKLLAETGWALGAIGCARLSLGTKNDAKVAGVLARAWSWPYRAGWKRGALPLLEQVVKFLRDERGGRVLGEVLARLEGAWEAAPDDRPLLEEAMGCCAQALGGTLFDKLLPLRLGTSEERKHLVPILAKHLQGTDLAFFGRVIVPVLGRAPFAGQLIPGLCVLAGDMPLVWRKHVVPLLVSWIGGSRQQQQWAAQAVLRAAASWRQLAAQQTGPMALHGLLRFAEREKQAQAVLAELASSASALASPFLDAFLGGRDDAPRSCLDAAASLAAFDPKLAAGLLRGALAMWLQGGGGSSNNHAKAMAACCALLAAASEHNEEAFRGEEWNNVASKLSKAVAPGVQRGEKSAWRAAAALLRANKGGKELRAAMDSNKWEDMAGGAARHRLEARRLALDDKGGDEAAAAAVALREALLGWRDHGPKARVQAELLLEATVRRSSSPAQLVAKRLSALLALPDTAVVTAGVGMLAHLLRDSELRQACENDEAGGGDLVWDGVCAAVLALSRTETRELQTVLLSYWMAATKAGLLQDEPAKTAAVTAALFAWSEEARSALRREMKVLVERLMKAAGPNAVADAMPSLEGKRLVAALAKKKRRKKNEYEKSKLRKADGKVLEQKDKKKKNERFLDPEVDDLMSTTTSVSSVKPKQGKRALEEEFDMDPETGKPLVLDPEDEDMLRQQREEAKAKARGGDAEDYEPEDEEEDGDGAEEQKKKKQQQKKPKKNKDQKLEVMGGKMYKAKKAQGDLKKGKFEPFAYVKLDPKTLNRRRVGHTADQFSEMFQKKRPGVKRGHKHTNSKYQK